MDLKGIFRKIRQVESTIADEFAIIASLETVDGGREGVLTEVSRYMAAKLITEGRARLAHEEEVRGFREKTEAGRREFLENQASRVQISVLSEQDIKTIKAALKPPQKG